MEMKIRGFSFSLISEAPFRAERTSLSLSEFVEWLILTSEKIIWYQTGPQDGLWTTLDLWEGFQAYVDLVLEQIPFWIPKTLVLLSEPACVHTNSSGMRVGVILCFSCKGKQQTVKKAECLCSFIFICSIKTSQLCIPLFPLYMLQLF